jgi:alpha-beta hydrolase superfamily lysophospholipase
MQATPSWPSNCRNATHIAVAGAKHEILMERDDFRACNSGPRSTN